MISGSREVPKECVHTVSVPSRVSVGLKGDHEPSGGIEGKEVLLVELSGTVTRNWEGVGDVMFVIVNVIYEELIPNFTRGMYMTRVRWMLNKNAWSRESPGVVRRCSGRPYSTS